MPWSFYNASGKLIDGVIDGSVTTAKLADDAVTIAKLAATGTADGTTFLRGDNSWAAAGGDLSFGGDTFGANKIIGANDAYSLSLETSGNTALTIAAAGEVTMPLQPAFLGRSSTTVSHSSANLDVVPISTMSKNIGSHFNNTGSTANGIPAYSFKAPVAGLYLFTCLMVISAKANATTRYEIRYTHDNSSGSDQGENFFARPWIGDAQPGEIRLSYSQLIYMAATDSVRLRGGGYGGTSTLNTYSWFSGHLVA